MLSLPVRLAAPYQKSHPHYILDGCMGKGGLSPKLASLAGRQVELCNLLSALHDDVQAVALNACARAVHMRLLHLCGVLTHLRSGMQPRKRAVLLPSGKACYLTPAAGAGIWFSSSSSSKAVLALSSRSPPSARLCWPDCSTLMLTQAALSRHPLPAAP